MPGRRSSAAAAAARPTTFARSRPRSTIPSGRDRAPDQGRQSSCPRSSGRSAGRELLDMIRAIEDLGFDSIWVGEHLLYRWETGRRVARGRPGRCSRPSPPSTDRVEFGPLVACTNFHNPALLAKQAATIDEISGGRFVLGLGAGWNETEFRAFGFPYDHRDRPLRGGVHDHPHAAARRARSTSTGRFYQARDCELLPRGPRPRVRRCSSARTGRGCCA